MRARSMFSPEMAHTEIPLHRREWLLFAALVLLAGALRFQRIDYAEFVWDQAHLSLKAIDMARGGQIAWAGVRSSTGVDSFMAFTWLMAIPYAVSLDPLLATAFIAALNVASVAATFFLARRWFGPVAAFTATLLYAVSPWAIEYSRKIWPMEPMPLFTLGYVAAGWLAFVRGRRWALVAHALLAASLAQMHFSGLPVIVISGVWAIAFRKRIERRALGVAALLAALTFAPYVLHDAQQNWFNLDRFRALSALPAAIDLDAARGAWRISTGSDFASLAGPDLAPQIEAAAPNARFLFPAQGALLLLGLAAAGGIALRRIGRGFDDRSAAAFMTATWLAIPILFQVRHVWAVSPSYFTLTYPSQFVLIGLLAREAGRIGRRWQIGLVGLIAVIAAAQVAESIAVYGFVAARHTPNGFGTSLRFVREMGETARRLSDELGGAEIIVLSDGGDPRSHEFPRTADVLFYGRPHRAADVYSTLVLPPHPAVYVAPAGSCSGERLLSTLTPERVDRRVRTRQGGGPYRFYVWSGGPAPEYLFRGQALEAPVEWSNGVSLAGYFVDGEARAGETMRWALVWSIGQGADTAQAFHWFNHLLDTGGNLVAQADGPAYLPFYWRAGDTVLTWLDASLPTHLPGGEYTMRVGLYAYPDVINVPLADGSGEFILIAPITIR